MPNKGIIIRNNVIDLKDGLTCMDLFYFILEFDSRG